MTDKKKQGAVVAVATMLTVTSVLSPVATVYAIETDTAIVQQTETEQVKENAPPIELPQELAGFAGQTLQEIALPEGWNWTDETTVISKDKMEYPARITVDDETYDYSNIEGYYADGHYVERNVVIAVTEQEPVTESKENQPTISTFGSDLDKDVFSSPKAGNVVINEDTFPDTTFREWVIANLQGAQDRTLTPDEIKIITDINLEPLPNGGDIKSLQGIEYFTELKNLNCYATGNTSLDVSQNSKLETLKCSGNSSLNSLVVKGAKSLKQLVCSGTGITALDVSENKALTNLNCSNTKTKELDVSYNTALTRLSCESNEELVSINVNGATALKILECAETGISVLDVSENKALEYLSCFRTKIKSLDVSKNIVLEQLYCQGNPLLWMNVGTNPNLINFLLPTPTISTNIIADSFNIKDVVKDIDLQKVAIVSTGLIDSNGVISKYDINQPIQYEYDCGTAANGQAIKLTVNLELAIDINEANFPDRNFRQYVSDNFDTSNPKDGKLTASEINQITEIRVSDRTDITSLKGIEYFTALNILYCSATGITSLDVSNNKALTELSCYNTKIKSLNVKKNTELTTLICDRTEIENLDVNQNTKLTKLRCFGTKIQSLDVSSNTKLTELDCYNNASLKNLKVDGAVDLTILWCHDTGIENLDVSQNTKLTELYCYNTKIESLDVSTNTILTKLVCYNTKIENLDVSSNTYLTVLDCSGTAIAYLNMGTNNDLSVNKSNLKPVSLGVKGVTGSFNMTDKFTDIDVSKITNVEGADYEKGIMSNYNVGTPITYTYACGTSKNGNETIDVILNLSDIRANSTISVTEDLNKIYNKKAVNAAPAVSTTGSSGAVSFKWEKKINDTDWKKITSAPTDAGTYRVTATLASDSNYIGATSEPKEFTISQADSTIVVSANLDKTYDGTVVSVIPSVTKTGSNGKVSFKWEKKVNDTDWEDIASAPTDAGTYRVTAILASDSNYMGATSEPKEFTISQADSTISVTEELNKTYDNNSVNATPAVSITGSNGAVSFKWEKKVNDTVWKEITSVPTDAGTYRVTATLASDSNYKGATSEPKEFTISQADSTISVTEELNKIYDKNSVNATPAVSITGSNGAVSFKWEKKVNDTDWEEITSAPTDAGIYRVTATLASDKNYKEATSTPVEFTISQADSTISITEDLSKAFDGKTVNTTPTVNKTGSKGAVSYKWERKMNATEWENISSAPTDAGTYRVTAKVDADDNYKGEISDTKEFTIVQASNSWIDNLTITGWTYGDEAVSPSAKANFGTVVFTYSDSKDGAYTDTVPTNAGTWYVKATVADSDNYNGLESIISFTISSKSAENNNQIVIPDINSDKDVENLVIKDGDKELIKGTDYDVEKKQDNNKVTVTITFKGNYAGTVIKTYIVEDKKPSVNPDTNKPSDSTKNDKTPAVETGDTNTTGIWAMLITISAGTTALLKGKKRKKETEE